MKRIKNDERGWTLIESVIVLGITLMMYQIPSLNLAPLWRQLEEQWFIQEVQSRLEGIQTFAITTGSTTYVSTHPSSNDIRFRSYLYPDHPLNRNVPLPQHLSFLSKNPQSFHFKNHSGNISSATTITFVSDSKTIKLVMQLGSGRYVIEEG